MSGPLSFGAAAALAAMMTLVGAPVARLVGAVSWPRDDRWHQSGPIPSFGGPALLIGLSPFIEAEIAVALALFCLIGLVDDIWRLGPLGKALLLIIPSAFSAWLLELGWVLPACWIAANAFNLLDHADGLATTTCLAILLVIGGPLGYAGAGVCFGFLLHNWSPARVFLGDSGSLMLGAMVVLASASSGPVTTLAGLAVPLGDSIFVIARRIAARSAPWRGGTDHSGHTLLRKGVSPHVLPVLYGLAAATVAVIGREQF